MKNKILIIAISAMLCMYGCGTKDPNKLIVRQWGLQSFTSQSINDRMAMMKNALDTAKDSNMRVKIRHGIDMQNQYMSDMTKMVMDCNADGTFKTTMVEIGQKSENTGTWQLINQGKTLVMTSSKAAGRGDTLTVDTLTANHLSISGPDRYGGRVVMVYKAVSN